MKYRQYKVTATSQWLNVLFTVDGPQFSVPEASHRADIAKALGLSPADLEVVDADSDLRVGLLLDLPPKPPRQPTAADIRWSRITELLAIPRSDWTVAQQRELLQIIAQSAVGG